MRIYPDSSFIVGLYIPELQTSVALREFERLQADGSSILLSELSFFETTNALHLAVFRKTLEPGIASELLEEFRADVDSGVFRLMPHSAQTWQMARSLSDAHSESMGCRCFDILHVAIASSLNVELFLTFDQRQRSLAIGAGLNAPDLYS